MKHVRDTRHSVQRVLHRALWGLAFLAVTSTGLPAHAAPVHVNAPEKQPDNLVDPNAEPAAASSSDKAGPATSGVDLALTEKGIGLYKAYCQKCHGLDMVTPGGGFFDLRTFPLDDKPRFVGSVTNGKRAMPAWGAVLKSADIDALWSYVASAQLSKKQKP